MKKKIENSEMLDTVHTHTHTHGGFSKSGKSKTKNENLNFFKFLCIIDNNACLNILDMV